eukprot:6371488-Prymnesium_polylepis.1
MNWRAAKLQVQAIDFLVCRVQQPTVVEVEADVARREHSRDSDLHTAGHGASSRLTANGPRSSKVRRRA